MMAEICVIFATLAMSQMSQTPTPNVFTSSATTATGNKFVDKMRLDSIDNSVRQLQNGRPTITGLPTFQNGFSSGNSSFTGTAYHTGTATFTATVTFTKLIYISSGIGFADGSTLVSAASARTTSGFGTLSQTAFGPAVSTVTISTNGGEVTCWFSGGAYSSSDNRHLALNILEDGAYVSPYTTTSGIASAYVCTGCGTHPQNLSFHKIFRAPAGGSHSYALTPLTAISGNFVFDTTDSKPEFGCAESR